MSVSDQFLPLLPAEKRLLSLCGTADRIPFGDGDLPSSDLDDIEIRAALIRTLLLDQDPDHQLDPKGLRLRGARISGVLDLQGCDCRRDISLLNCVLTDAPNLVNADLRGLHLNGCQIPGLHADNARFSGSVFLRNQFLSTGVISLPGARIDGDLQLCDARLETRETDCLFAASIRVEGSAYFGDYPYSSERTSLFANGALVLSSARISQDFFFSQVSIAPDDETLAANEHVDGEEGDNVIALSLVRADISGILHMKNNQISRGTVNLSGARTRRLNDEPTGPGAAFPLRLDGFTYEAFAQHSDISKSSRLDWLARRPRRIAFSAQPYEQLASVLFTIGHREDARDILMRKQGLQNAENRRLRRQSGGTVQAGALWVADRIMYYVTGYGYRPVRALLWAVLAIALLAFYFDRTWNAGDMAPNAAPILISSDWIAATNSHPENPASYWSSPGQAGQDYETFHPVAYAFDLFVPLVNLGQNAAWAPSTSRSPLGWHGWWIRWFAETIGWVITVLGAAAITGVVRND